jgi:UDP-glucose 4-epimerase
MIRRTRCLRASVALLSLLVAAAAGAQTAPDKLIILGFDGVDAKLTEQWMNEGKLPNLAKLRAEGSFSPLRPTIPSQTPVSWSTFSTGLNPGRHGVFDFLKRDPQTYVPAFAAAEEGSEPFLFGRQNGPVVGAIAGLTLLAAMRATNVSRLVFSSTAAVYGEPLKQPIEEDDPTKPTNPYGQSKLAFEGALHWYGPAYNLRFASLRYFNAAGATERCGEMHEPETHLIPIVLQVAAGKRSHVDVYGDDYPTPDGTCVRDYIHVIDLARAHVLALSAISERSRIFNLGCGGDGYSVKQVIDVAREVTGKEIPVRMAQRRAGDPAVLIASSERIKTELGWKPEFQDLRAVIGSAWRWQQNHPEGYDSH